MLGALVLCYLLHIFKKSDKYFTIFLNIDLSHNLFYKIIENNNFPNVEFKRLNAGPRMVRPQRKECQLNRRRADRIRTNPAKEKKTLHQAEKGRCLL